MVGPGFGRDRSEFAEDGVEHIWRSAVHITDDKLTFSKNPDLSQIYSMSVCEILSELGGCSGVVVAQ